MPTKIFVGNVASRANSSELRTLFEKYGHVEECAILKNFAFVHMSSEDEAREAINALDNHTFAGESIHVELSHGRPGKGGRGGGGGRGGSRGGFRGGRGGGGDRYGGDRYSDRGYGSRPPPSRGYERRENGYPPHRDYYERQGRYAPYDSYERRGPQRDAGFYRERSPVRRAEAYYRRSPPASGRYAYDAYEYGSRRQSPPPADRYY